MTELTSTAKELQDPKLSIKGQDHPADDIALNIYKLHAGFMSSLGTQSFTLILILIPLSMILITLSLNLCLLSKLFNI